MSIPGLPLAEFLPRPTGTTMLLLGGDAKQAAALRRAGYRLDRHALDMGPLAQVAGAPFNPPIVAWPFPDASYDAVILLDELALTVLEEEALAEAARVLRPGGTLLLRVPVSGGLAWLDGFNAYRYLHETSRHGVALAEIAGVGWRRHYPRADVAALLNPHFRVREMREFGVGLSDTARLALNVYWRWVRQSEKSVAAIQRFPERLTRLEGRWSLGGRGYWLVTAAERLPAGAS